MGKNHEFCRLIGVQTLLMRTKKEKLRLTNESEDLALLISKVQLGSYEMPFEEYVVMEGEDIIHVEYCM